VTSKTVGEKNRESNKQFWEKKKGFHLKTTALRTAAGMTSDWALPAKQGNWAEGPKETATPINFAFTKKKKDGVKEPKTIRGKKKHPFLKGTRKVT